MVDFLANPEPAEEPTFAGPEVIGDRNENIRRAEALDPTEVEEVTDDEQAQYEDFVGRALAMIADTRQPEDGSPSPSEAVIAVMNNSSFSIAEALAEGAVSTITMLHDAAKRAEQPYGADVLFHGADEVIAGLYLLGSQSGIFKDTPDHSWATGAQAAEPAPEAPAEPAMQAPAPAPAEPGMEPPVEPEAPAAAPAAAEGEMPSEGDFTDEEYITLGEAKILAVEKFGQRLAQSGQLGEAEQKEAQDFWKSQIEKEVELGNVQDSMFDNMDLSQIRQRISTGGAQ